MLAYGISYSYLRAIPHGLRHRHASSVPDLHWNAPRIYCDVLVSLVFVYKGKEI
jgi:hypothetical protein